VIGRASTPQAIRRVAWTPRAFLVVGFGGLLTALSVALHSPVPLLAAIPLLLAPVVTGLRSPPGLSRADLAWDAHGTGTQVEISGVLRGDFGSSVVDVAVDLPPPPGVRVTRQLRTAPTADAIRFDVAWRLSEPSILALDPPSVVWCDPIGLSERTTEGERPPVSVLRYPATFQRITGLPLVRTTSLPGDIRSRALGESGEFYGLREAAPGEPRRRINWRASARTGRPVVNDYLLDRTGDLVVLLDTRPTVLGAALDERLLGVGRAAALGLAETFLRSKIRIGLATYGEFLEAVPLSTGRIHRVRIEQAVLRARRAPVAGPAERCSLGLRRYYRPGTTMLIVSAWAGDPTYNLLPYVEKGGFPGVLLSPSPLPMRAGTVPLDPLDERLAVRLERLQRRAVVAELWRDGPVVDWDDYWSLDPLARVLRRPAHRKVA
jgi:uncharacterized protein (DUF58 family)